MTPVSSDLEIVAVRAAVEADSRGDHIGRSATLLFNQHRDRTRGVVAAVWQDVFEKKARRRLAFLEDLASATR